jgi:hypothetical protein
VKRSRERLNGEEGGAKVQDRVATAQPPLTPSIASPKGFEFALSPRKGPGGT